MSARLRCPRCAALRAESDFAFSDELGKVCGSCLDRFTRLRRGFVPWTDIHRLAPPEPAWVLEHYIARGWVTLLAGKPKTGKSTFASDTAQAVDAEAEAHLGLGVGGGPVIYVSEEGPGTLAPKLSRSTGSVALTREVWPKPCWADVVDAACAVAEDLQAVLLVIDSLGFWSSFREGQEKDAGAAQAAMDALGAATSGGHLAVLLVHHQRKVGGDEGDAVRGSGAILGAVDLSIELERLGDDAPTQRRLVAVGRWPDTPPVLVVERDAGTRNWRAVGHAASREEAAAMGMRERILNALTGAEKPISEDQLADVLDADGRKVSRPLRELVDQGRVTRSGEGKKGNPYTYSNAPPKCSPEAGGESPLKCSPSPIGGEHQHLVLPPPRGEKGEKAARVEVWDYTGNGEAT